MRLGKKTTWCPTVTCVVYNNINIVIPYTEAWANIEVYVLTTTAHQHWGMVTVLYLNFEVWHINELYLMSKCIEVYEGFCISV